MRNCLYLEQCAKSMVAQLESGGGARSQAKLAVAQIVLFFSFFLFLKKEGSGVKAEFHRKDLEFSMELGAVCMKVVAVSATYPRPDHCKRQRRERLAG